MVPACGSTQYYLLCSHPTMSTPLATWYMYVHIQPAYPMHTTRDKFTCIMSDHLHGVSSFKVSAYGGKNLVYPPEEQKNNIQHMCLHQHIMAWYTAGSRQCVWISCRKCAYLLALIDAMCSSSGESNALSVMHSNCTVPKTISTWDHKLPHTF